MKAAGAALLALALAASVQARTPVPLTPDARSARQMVLQRGDHHGVPFIVIDKRAARLWLFDGRGRPRGSAPVLLGLARGDDAVPGIGDKPLRSIRDDERTTPAGRFHAEHGRNAAGEDILWVDYELAVSLHRLRSVSAGERRAQRLASPTPDDNRISYGCINVPPRFYDRTLRPLLGARDPMVYVLPETRPVTTLFPAG